MDKKSNLKVLMEYAGNYKYLTYISWVLSGISAIIALVPFVLIWQIIKIVLEKMPNINSSNSSLMIHYGILAVIFSILSIFIYIAGLMCSHLSAFRVQNNLKSTMMHHIVKLPLGSLNSFGSGNIRKIVNDCSEATETFLAHQLPDMAGAIVTPIALLIMLIIFDWRLGLLSIVPVILGFVIMMSKMGGEGLKDKMKEYQNALGDMSNEAVEYVRGIPIVKTFGQSVFAFKRFKNSIDRYSKWAIAYTKEMRMPMLIYTTAINAVFAFLIIGGMVISRNQITSDFILNIMFYIIITPIISVTLTKIMHQSESIMIVSDALERIDSILNIKPFENVKDKKEFEDYSIELKNVSYSYDGVKKALNNVSLHIKSGETVAFVGPSGGGKSTLANVICRFFDPQEGQVLIGNNDVKTINKNQLMENVSFVFQNSKLIKGSILENIKMGKPDSTLEEVMEALNKAQCMDIIEKFPDGVNTVIGSEGVYLSGGEKQRIAIARAILKNAPIIILDEATAYADPDNENKVQMAFSELSKDKTVIMIAHRLSTVVNADCIYVIKDGNVIEKGTKNQLMDKKGMFCHMWQDYQTAVDWKIEKEAGKNA